MQAQWRTYLMRGALLLNFSSLNIQDQYAQKPNWSSIGDMPTLLVLAGEKSSEMAMEWGLSLHKALNGAYLPGKNHLTARSSQENVKVVAVATLPSVPGIFRGMFRSGFRKKTEMAMLLDYSAELSSKFAYSDSETLPAIVVIPKGTAVLQDVKVFRGRPDDSDLRLQVLKALSI